MAFKQFNEYSKNCSPYSKKAYKEHLYCNDCGRRITKFPQKDPPRGVIYCKSCKFKMRTREF